MDVTVIDNIAQAVAVFTPNGAYTKDEIFTTYGLDEVERLRLEADDYYIERIAFHTKEIGTDKDALIHAQARLMATSLLRPLFEMANDTEAKPSDRAKAMAMLFDLAGVAPTKEDRFDGVVLQVNFGEGLTTRIAPEIIEHEKGTVHE